MSIATTARRAALDGFTLSGRVPDGDPLPLRSADPAHYLTGDRLRLAQEAVRILRSRPEERHDVESLAAALVPRIVELVGRREIAP